MAKQVFICPNCSHSSTFSIENQTTRYPQTGGINIYHQIIRCDVCEELTYKIVKIERIYQGSYAPPEIKNEEHFQYPFGYLNIEQTLPTKIENYYIEAYECFKIGALRGSASMCRATISAICDDKKSTGADLKERIEQLPLSQRLKNVAKNIKWIGDKTLHNEIDWAQANWNKSLIEEILSFISRIIDDLYTQERKAKELNKAVSTAGQSKK